MDISKQIPNLFTLVSLLLGAISIVFLFDGRAMLVPYLIFLAALFDFLDGFAAKMLNAYSEIGKQLDSLSDMISFGLVPGCVFYYLLTNNPVGEIIVNEHSISILVPAFAVTFASAIRLARFNVNPGPQGYFRGLPTPGCAIFVVSLLLVEQNIDPEYWFLLSPYSLYIYMAILSILLLSNVKMFNLKFTHYALKQNEVRYLFLLGAAPLIIVLKFMAAPFIILLYIILSLGYNLFKHEVPSGN